MAETPEEIVFNISGIYIRTFEVSVPLDVTVKELKKVVSNHPKVIDVFGNKFDVSEFRLQYKKPLAKDMAVKDIEVRNLYVNFFPAGDNY